VPISFWSAKQRPGYPICSAAALKPRNTIPCIPVGAASGAPRLDLELHWPAGSRKISS